MREETKDDLKVNMVEDPITVRDIVIEYLQKNNYEGIYNEEIECGCFIDDLVPCGGSCCECSPGVKMKMTYEGELIDGIGPLPDPLPEEGNMTWDCPQCADTMNDLTLEDWKEYAQHGLCGCCRNREGKND
jgi:hypothetical protein